MLLRDSIYDALRAAILQCDLPPGQELREQDLAARYRVSRSPVRDALLRLEKGRLITVLPRQGYRVNPISLEDATEIFALRLIMEPACAAAAAQGKGVGRDVAALDAWRDADGEDFVAYNRGFHAAVADLAGNGRMAAVVHDLIDQSDRLVRVSVASPEVADRQLMAEHGAIIDAIQAGDAALAERLMRAHVMGARDRVLTALRDVPGCRPKTPVIRDNAA
ncbi:MAG TPA: GntR family transcriptional regulator [Rhodopila sp.]|uniref:GntR family transcriptional regulator n=1 Tax=Rhodopila sp. TaxID=2480087 RepID=UPI002C069732|nr:GntR family transcriptional regulator [Rhodopila sp.]HVY17028.1 GntR family transcriptional regulator [Rhodopila sp.]